MSDIRMCQRCRGKYVARCAVEVTFSWPNRPATKPLTLEMCPGCLAELEAKMPGLTQPKPVAGQPGRPESDSGETP